MDYLSNRYNKFLIVLMVFAPFVSFVAYEILYVDFKTAVQFLSLLGVFLILFFKSKNYPLRFPLYLFFYLLFIIYVFYSDLIRLDREFKIDYLFKNRLIGGFALMFIIENSKYNNNFFIFLLRVSKYILIVAFIVILLQQVIDPNIFVIDTPRLENEVYNENDKRLYSIYSYLGTILSAGFSFVPIFFILTEKFDKENKNSILWLIMGIIFVFLTKQRWIMVNFSLVFFIFFIYHKDVVRRIFKYIILLPISIAIIFSSLELVGIDSVGIIEERILESNKKNLNETSASTRLLGLKAFKQLYWETPILGTGNIKYGMGGTGEQEYELRKILKGRSSQIHVGYLSLLYLYGLIGAFLFLSFLYLLLKKLYIDAKTTKYWAPFLGFFGIVLNNFVDVNFQVFEMGLILALVVNTIHVQNNRLND